ncbi:MAG: lytic transglycosylase domain-containing protein [Sandarakinorhabdus sp.]|nr:lytic transglycosylase domain-containing protein [Sandarakinorhabdus sp.]
MAQARLESGLDPAAQARTSSARGLYQFTNATWLETVRKHGAEHGLGWAADAIANGAARAGTAARATILGLRDNAEAAALMAGEFASDNGAALAARLGRAVGATDLYMAHFLGAGGAAKFLAVLAGAPGTAAASILPAAAAANRRVFFAKDGTARTVAEVYARFERKLGGADQPLTRAGPATNVASATVAVSRPLPQGEKLEDRARMAYMLLAALS